MLNVLKFPYPWAPWTLVPSSWRSIVEMAKYMGFNSNCFCMGYDISPLLIYMYARKSHEVFVAGAINLPYKKILQSFIIWEKQEKKGYRRANSSVWKGRIVLIIVWAVKQEDHSLLSKWTPLLGKYNERLVSHSNPQVCNSATLMLE